MHWAKSKIAPSLLDVHERDLSRWSYAAAFEDDLDAVRRKTQVMTPHFEVKPLLDRAVDFVALLQFRTGLLVMAQP